jgi:hypothetical protein
VSSNKNRVLETARNYTTPQDADVIWATLHQLEDFKSALMVSGASASEDGSLEKRLRGGKPSSRSGRSLMRTVKQYQEANKRIVFDGQPRGRGDGYFLDFSSAIFALRAGWFESRARDFSKAATA